MMGASLVSSKRSALSSISLMIVVPFSSMSCTSCSAESLLRSYDMFMAERIAFFVERTTLKSYKSRILIRSSRGWKEAGSFMAITQPGTWKSSFVFELSCWCSLFSGPGVSLLLSSGTMVYFFRNWIGTCLVKSALKLSNGSSGLKGISYWMLNASRSWVSVMIFFWISISPALPPFSFFIFWASLKSSSETPKLSLSIFERCFIIL